MSDLYEDDDNDSTLVRQLRKQLREQSKKVEELSEQNTTLAKQVRSKSVEEILASKGADKRIAKYIPADVDDEAGILAWLESDGDLFGYQKDDGDSAGDDPAGLSPEDAAAARQVQQVTGGGVAVADRQKQQLDAVRNASTREELDALIFGAQSGT
jgi:hypothetical protein